MSDKIVMISEKNNIDGNHVVGETKLRSAPRQFAPDNVQYLVSICIPTYNRCEMLKSSLETLVHQPLFGSGKVEIVVNDNTSTDGTEEMLQEYAESYPDFHFYRNTENVKDKNFPICISRACGTLRKICNDTLLYFDNFLEVVCKYAEQYWETKPILFFENGYAEGKKRIKEKDLDFNNFMLRESYMITHIARMSLWDSDCEDILNDDPAVFSTQLWQVSKLASILSSGRKTVAIEERIFSIQDTDKAYYLKENRAFNIFYINFFSILNPYVQSGQLLKVTRDIVERDLLFSYFLYWLVIYDTDDRYNGYSTDELKRSIRKVYRKKTYYPEFKARYYVRIMKSRLESKEDGRTK